MDPRCGDGSKPIVSSMLDEDLLTTPEVTEALMEAVKDYDVRDRGIAAMSAEELARVRQYNAENDVQAPLGYDVSIGNPGTPNPYKPLQGPTEPDIRYIPGPTSGAVFQDVRPQPEGSDTMVLDFSGEIDGGGVKDSMVDPENKPMMSLVPRALILGCAKALTYGAKKYAANNWRRGMRWSGPADALLRHFTAWLEGEDIDPESGLSHLAHVAANLGFLMHMETNYEYALMDDRPQTRRFTEDG